MNNWVPNELYRYRSVGTEHFVEELENLKEGKVWLNFLDNQNDPFEGAILPQETPLDEFEVKLNELRTYLNNTFPSEQLLPEALTPEAVTKANQHVLQFSQFIIEKVIVASFTKSWDNTLMWGHYADGFAGICLKFEFDYSEAQSNGPPLFQVLYWKDEPPKFSGFQFYAAIKLSYALKNIRSKEHYGSIADIAHEAMKLAVMSKSFDWVYEEEFRMISIDSDPGYYPVPGFKLKEVIFGNRSEKKTISEVISALGDGIQYSQMVLSPNRYGYGRERIGKDVIDSLLK